jgi:EAL domain-containing protein (putative c-di-GMP-specific phosphodiesterase class I)
MKYRNLVKEIILNKNITSWYQPIINTQKKKVLGWEVFSRGPMIPPMNTFQTVFSLARQEGMSKPLELMCIKEALKCFNQLSLSGKLFLNISHEIFWAGNHLRQHVGQLAESSPVPPYKIVLTLDFDNLNTTSSEFESAVRFYHKLGFQIALNNIGNKNTQLGIEDLFARELDYIKISSELIDHIFQDTDKQKTVASILVDAQESFTKVIATGVESEPELNTINNIGVRLQEGILFQEPLLSPQPPILEGLT